MVTAIRLLVFTGARLSEILNLRWDQVDFDRKLIIIPQGKTGRRIIYLNAPALEILASRRGDAQSEWVLAGARRGQPLVNLRKPWYRLRAMAKLEDVRIHDLRHTFASVGAAGGLSLPLLGALLGHTQPATTARYAHLGAEPARVANDAALGSCRGTCTGALLLASMPSPVKPEESPVRCLGGGREAACH